MKELLLCLLVLHVATTKLVASGELVELSFTQQQVHGKYANRDEIHGITFVSRADDYLFIKTFAGEAIIETNPISSRDGKKLRSVYIMGREYLQHESSSHSDQPINHDTPLSDAVKELMNMKEIGLLEEAAKAIGQKGVTGKNTPAVMPFFVFALRITQFQSRNHGNIFLTNTTRVKRADCFNTCPPCPNDECLGMCGFGCNCWSFFCGDCCYHLGCYEHDLCCRVEFVQSRCLLPLDFRCDQPYPC